MPVEIDISLLGDKRLERKFKQLPIIMQKKILRVAFRDTAKDILRDARVRIPRSTIRHRDGKHLADTLKVRALKRSRKSFGVKVETGTREELGIDPDDPYYYPAAIELGAAGVSAQSFLRSSLEINRGPGMKKIIKSVRQGIKDASNL